MTSPRPSTPEEVQVNRLWKATRRAFTQYQIWWYVFAGAAAVFWIDSGPLCVGFSISLVGKLIENWAGGTLVKEKRMTTGGPYAFVRNPMYVGRFIMGFGWSLLLGYWWIPIVYAIGYAIYAHARVGREEPRLRRRHAASYTEYCRHVHRWIPRLLPWRGATPAGFSIRKAARNGQLTGTLLLLILMLLTTVRVMRFHDIQAEKVIGHLVSNLHRPHSVDKP